MFSLEENTKMLEWVGTRDNLFNPKEEMIQDHGHTFLIREHGQRVYVYRGAYIISSALIGSVTRYNGVTQVHPIKEAPDDEQGLYDTDPISRPADTRKGSVNSRARKASSKS